MNAHDNDSSSSDDEENFVLRVPGVDIETEIDNLINMDPIARKANGKKSKVTLEDLKRMAKHLQIPRTQAKGALVDAILSRRESNRNIEAIRGEELSGGTHRKDKNTYIRYPNFLMSYPDALQRSSALANRMQLQFGETADKQPIFIETAALFNDRNMNSGGLVIQHEVFDRKDINLEVVGP